MELEIAMIEEHGLTLPPAIIPAMHPSEKSSYLDWRRKTLEDLRRERVRREVLSKLAERFSASDCGGSKRVRGPGWGFARS